MNLKQSTVYTRMFLMIDSTDHISGKTGLTVTIKVSKAGATFVTPGGTITEVDSTNLPGLYKIALTTTDTNTIGDLAFYCSSAGADPTNFIDQIYAQGFDDLLGAVNTLSELAQAAPAATPTAAAALMLLYMALRNLRSETNTLLSIANDAGTVICKGTLSDDGTTFQKAKLASGP